MGLVSAYVLIRYEHQCISLRPDKYPSISKLSERWLPPPGNYTPSAVLTVEGCLRPGALDLTLTRVLALGPVHSDGPERERLWNEHASSCLQGFFWIITDTI